MKKSLFALLALFVVTPLIGCNKQVDEKRLSAPSAYLDGTTVKWNAVTNATQYKLYENDVCKYEALVRNQYDIVVSETGTYKYYVVAVDALGIYKESNKSNVVTYNYTKPEALEAPVISLSNNVVSWNAVTGAEKYNIYSNGSLYTTVQATSYTLPFTNIGAYKIQVQSKRGIDEVSEFSNKVVYKYTTGVTESTATEWDRAGMFNEWTITGKIETEVSEGFDMTAGSTAYVYHEITNVNKYLKVSIRNFVRSGEIAPKFYVEVDGDIVRADGATKDYVTLNSDTPIDFTYDLSSYIGEKVFIKFKEAAATHCCITSVKMLGKVGPEITTNTSWVNKEGFAADWFTSNVNMNINEGPDFAGSGKAQLKTAISTDNCVFYVNWRMFVDQDIEGARVELKVNNDIVKADGVSEDYIELDYTTDETQTFMYDFTSFIGQVVVIELASVNPAVNHCVFLSAYLTTQN